MPSEADLEDGVEPGKDKSTWRIVQLARPEWPFMGLGLVLLTLSLAPFLALPIMIGRVLDALVENDTDAEKQQAVNGIVIILVTKGCGVVEKLNNA